MTSAGHLQMRIRSHAEKVLSLYKRALRNTESRHLSRHTFRLEAVRLRQRFDEHKDEKDMRKAKMLLLAGEAELKADLHCQPFKFAFSPGGINYQREAVVPDCIIDIWHPLEKAQYPEYFARREQRKEDLVEIWNKKYGKPEEPQEY